HFWRIAGYQEQVVQPKRRGAEEVGHHPEKVPVAATVMKHRFDPDLFVDENRGRKRGHSSLGSRAVRNVDAVNAGLVQKADRFEGFLGVAAFRRQNLDRGNEFTASDLLRPKTAVLAANDLN